MKIYTLGRGSDCAVRVTDNDSLSRRHASITVVSPDEMLVEDLGSANGTFFIGQDGWHRARKGVLRPGSRVRFGSHELTFKQLQRLLVDAVYDVPRGGGDRPGRLGGSATSGENPPRPQLGRPRRNPRTGEVEEGD